MSYNRYMKYSNVWYWDGSLRDIYVLGVNGAHWQLLVDWLRRSPYPIEFYVDGKAAPLPFNAASIFEQSANSGVLLAIDIEEVSVHCHFFWHKEIEFDIDPREVKDEQKEQGVISFIRTLGNLLNKRVILTPENLKAPLLDYVPERDELIHDPTSLESIETKELSREEGLRLMAKVYGLEPYDESAVIERMIEAGNKPAYDENF